MMRLEDWCKEVKGDEFPDAVLGSGCERDGRKTVPESVVCAKQRVLLEFFQAFDAGLADGFLFLLCKFFVFIGRLAWRDEPVQIDVLIIVFVELLALLLLLRNLLLHGFLSIRARNGPFYRCRLHLCL